VNFIFNIRYKGAKKLLGLMDMSSYSGIKRTQVDIWNDGRHW